jgi:hypothetical protein
VVACPSLPSPAQKYRRKTTIEKAVGKTGHIPSIPVLFSSSSSQHQQERQSVTVRAQAAQIMEAKPEEPRPESGDPPGRGGHARVLRTVRAVIVASPDGDHFGPRDAQLDLQIPISTAPANHPPPLFPGPYTQIATFPSSPLWQVSSCDWRASH